MAPPVAQAESPEPPEGLKAVPPAEPSSGNPRGKAAKKPSEELLHAESASEAEPNDVEVLVRTLFTEREKDFTEKILEQAKANAKESRRELDSKLAELEAKLKSRPAGPASAASGGSSAADAQSMALLRRLQDVLVTGPNQDRIYLLDKCLNAASGSRPPEPSTPVGAGQQADPPEGTPQHKATWSSTELSAVAMIPAEAQLTHENLEQGLVEKAVRGQPSRSSLGYTEIVVRDLASSVVREIVGVLESLLDRLLMEKKQSTLRNIVGELVTTDLKSTIAAGSERFLKESCDNIKAELGQLREDLQARDANWEARFVVTQELRDSQDDLYTFMDKRYKDVEARLDSGEAGFVPRKELDERLAKVTSGLSDSSRRIVSVEERQEQHQKALNEHKEHCNVAYESRERMRDVEKRLTEGVASAREEARKEAADLRSFAAPLARLQEVEENHRKSMKELAQRSEAIDQTKEELSRWAELLTKADHYNKETYQTKEAHERELDALKLEQSVLASNLREAIKNLEQSAATKEALDESSSLAQGSLAKLEKTVTTAALDLQRTRDGLNTLEEYCNTKLATKEYAYDEANKLSQQAAASSDDKQEIQQLKREFEEERERLRQNVRQQQHARKDLNGTIEEVAILKVQSGELEKKHDALAEREEKEEFTEQEHYKEMKAGIAKRQQKQEDLELAYKQLREEFMSHVEFQRGEREKILQNSTQNYLEQMDKALHLQESLQKVVSGHEELKEDVRSIKLPKVA